MPCELPSSMSNPFRLSNLKYLVFLFSYLHVFLITLYFSHQLNREGVIDDNEQITSG